MEAREVPTLQDVVDVGVDEAIVCDGEETFTS